MLPSKYRYVLFTLLSILAFTNSQAGVSIIVSTPPPPREIIAGPPGYTTCYIVRPGYYGGIWQPKHRVCEYEGGSGLRMWVNGFWQCGSFRRGGICSRWHWIGGHWANRRDMGFYRRSAPRGYSRRYTQGPVHEHNYARGLNHGNSHSHGYDHDRGNRHDHH